MIVSARVDPPGSGAVFAQLTSPIGQRDANWAMLEPTRSLVNAERSFGIRTR